LQLHGSDDNTLGCEGKMVEYSTKVGYMPTSIKILDRKGKRRWGEGVGMEDQVRCGQARYSLAVKFGWFGAYSETYPMILT
jgi:hypothetical protein